MKSISEDELWALVEERSADNGFPIYGDFVLTPLCNFDCKMCYVHMIDPSVRERMLSGKQWIELLDEAIKNGLMTALLTGGEAMTHPDFWDIYMHLVQKGIPVTLKTNGYLLSGENLDKFVQYPPKQIDISLYGCNDDAYEAVTGKRAFETVLQNIKAAKEKELYLHIMITPSALLLPWIEETMALAKSLEVPVRVNGLLTEPEDGVDRKLSDFDLTLDQYMDVIRKKLKLFYANTAYAGDNEPEEEKEAFHYDKKGLPCNAGRTAFSIEWDGSMSPCISYPTELVQAFPLQEGFLPAWKKISQHTRNFVLPEKCHSCPSLKTCKYCPTTQGRKYSLLGQCNPSVCAYYEALDSLLSRK